MFNEREVIPRILKGDLKAYELLVRQYEKLVLLMIERLVYNREDVEDISQEVFIKIYKNLNTFAYQSKLSTWIARIAYLTAINHLKKNKYIAATDALGNVEDFYFTADNPETRLTKKDNFTYINDLIRQMPLQYRTVITLYHLNEFSYQEIETVTGMPEGTVKSYLFRARKLLKEKLEDYLKYEL